MRDYYLRFPSELTAENALRNASLDRLDSHDYTLVRIGSLLEDPGEFVPYPDWEGEDPAPIVQLRPPVYSEEYLVNLRWISGQEDDPRLIAILPYMIPQPANPLRQWGGGNVAYNGDQENIAVLAQIFVED